MFNQNFYVGFPTFEELLATAPVKQIYLTHCVVTRPGVYHTQAVDWMVVAGSYGSGILHYWRMRTGAYNAMNNVPMVSEKNYDVRCRDRSESAVKELNRIARDYGFRTIRGLIAFPKDLTLMDGTTRLITFNKQINRFEPVEKDASGSEKKAA